jgi:2-keto-3-deoxy-6-phosphogluconate aldolase
MKYTMRTKRQGSYSNLVIIAENAGTALRLTKELLERGAQAVEITDEGGQLYDVVELAHLAEAEAVRARLARVTPELMNPAFGRR